MIMCKYGINVVVHSIVIIKILIWIKHIIIKIIILWFNWIPTIVWFTWIIVSWTIIINIVFTWSDIWYYIILTWIITYFTKNNIAKLLVAEIFCFSWSTRAFYYYYQKIKSTVVYVIDIEHVIALQWDENIHFDTIQ